MKWYNYLNSFRSASLRKVVLPMLRATKKNAPA